MKTKTLVVICFTTISISLISCDWLVGKKPYAEKTKSIVGKWELVNIEDSSKDETNGIGILALAMSTKDSTPLIVEFKPDSIYGFFQNNKPLEDSGKYYVDSTIQTLFLKNNFSSTDDSAYSLVIKYQTDSSLKLFSNKDSIWYTLSKQ